MTVSDFLEFVADVLPGFMEIVLRRNALAAESQCDPRTAHIIKL